MRVAAALSVAITLALAGCATLQPTTTPGVVNVVASTNVWGSVARAIGGSHVTVTSIVDDPNKDPHEYAANARNQLEVSRAQVVIENGGGYDDFIDTMLAAANNPVVVKLNAVVLSGHSNDRDLNEHVWYDFVAVKKVAATLVTTLTKIDQANASDFRLNAQKFDDKLDGLISTEMALKSQFAGEGIAITEPVPVYILDAIGLVDKTPLAFSKAIEGGTDASPAVLSAAVAIFASRSVALLAYNQQTTGAETEAVLAAARRNNVPVVPVTETVPQSDNYVTWMTSNLAHIEAALKK